MYFFGFGCILFGTILYCLSEPKNRKPTPQPINESEINKPTDQLNEVDKLSTDYELFKV